MLPYKHISKLRVRYVETDQMGVVWHGNYLQYFEVARSEAIAEAGLGNYADMEETGVMMPIVDVCIHYHKSAVYDEMLAIHTFIEQPVSATMTFRYEIRNAEDVLLVDGSTTLAFIRKDNGRPCRPPQKLKEFFK